MAFTFPRALPSPNKIAKIKFYLSDNQTKGMTRGGSHQVADLAPRLWMADVATALLDDDNWGAWEAWLDSMRGGLNSFYLHRVGRRSMPFHYPDGFGGAMRAIGGLFDGAGTLDAVDPADYHNITLAALPQDFTLAAGDLLAFDYGSQRAFHRVGIGGTSSALGELDLTVAPALRSSFALDVPVYLEKPAAQMMIVPGSINWGSHTVNLGPQKIGFKAQQILVTS